MGAFDKIKSTYKKLKSNPTNFRNYADLGLETLTLGQVDTNGVNGVGSFKDALLGEKAADIAPDAIADKIRATQSRGITELNSALDTPADGIVTQQAELAKKSILTKAQDARRNAQRFMASKGLGASSLGLAADRSINREVADQTNAIDASLPGQIRDQKLKDAATRIGVGGVNQNGMNFNTIQGQREGGLLGYASALAPMAGSVGQLMQGQAAMNMANSYQPGGVKKPGQTSSFFDDSRR